MSEIIEVRVEGKKVQAIVSTDLSDIASDYSALSIFDAVSKSFSFYVKTSEKAICMFHMIARAKKSRLPRKLKKKLKKKVYKLSKK